MTAYERALIANGTRPEDAAVIAQRDELRRIQNRAHPSYGKYDPDPPSTEEVRQAYEFKYGSPDAA